MHVLGTPPAFVLSQDQTLKKLYLNNLSVAQIIFQVICSSKFYSRIFVGLNSIFTRNLNNSLLSKVFLVRLHVIQFTRYRRCSCKLSLATNFYMLSQLISFVKYFFKFLKTFSKCFKQIFSCKCCPPSSTPFIRQLSYVSTSSRICQELFSFLSNFFSICLAARSRRQLAYIIIASAICQRIFSPFFNNYIAISDFLDIFAFWVQKGPGAYAPGPLLYYI